MPELPEVETIRTDLLPLVKGRAIRGARLLPDPRGSRVLRRVPSRRRFRDRIRGRKILDIRRRGKYLLFRLDRDETLVIHLGMSGRLSVTAEKDRLPPHSRILFEISGGKKLVFADPRKFGEAFLLPGGQAEPPRLGPEPLGRNFTDEKLAAILKNRRAPIKAVLLDQKAVAGLGNIYTDEALFRARVHPLRIAAGLSGEEISRLRRRIREVLKEAIGARGTTAADGGYVDGKGREGVFQKKLRVYQRRGLPCPGCGSPVGAIRLAGRSAHFCPSCQTPSGKKRTCR